MCVSAHMLNCVQLFMTPWTVACQTPLSVKLPRQEYWSRLPCPPPGDLPNPGSKPLSPESHAWAPPLPLAPSGKQALSASLYLNK